MDNTQTKQGGNMKLIKAHYGDVFKVFDAEALADTFRDLCKRLGYGTVLDYDFSTDQWVVYVK